MKQLKMLPWIFGLLATFVLASQASLAADYPFTKEGYPTAQAAKAVDEDQFLQRAITAYRFWYPTISGEAMMKTNRDLGFADNEGMIILAAGPRHIGFTLNSDTPYGAMNLDLSKGPYVIELPAGPFIGLVDDHHQRWVLDMGIPGPDKGKGGKHLIVPLGYKGEIPTGYYVGRARTNKLIVAIRALPQDGNAKAALERLKQVKVYPLSEAGNPKPIRFGDVTNTKFDSTPLRWEKNIGYWQTLHKIINEEPLLAEFGPMIGLLKAIGIEKGKPFAPDAKSKALLERAAREAQAQLMVAAFASNRPDRIVWPGKKWEWAGLVATNGYFLTKGGIDLEARDRWFAQAIVTSPAMFKRTEGAGSVYYLGLRDATGAYLDGGKNYRLTLKAPVPANLFWSITLYDAQTRSQVVTAQDKAVLGSLYDKIPTNPDGTIDLYFGPKAPAGKEKQWIQTAPGRGWFCYFRIYGPQKPAFDNSWQLNDITAVK